MAGDLVPVANHALDELSPGQGRVVDGSFAEIAARDEECGLCVVFLEDNFSKLQRETVE